MMMLFYTGNQLSDSCAHFLIEGLKNNASLTSLDLSGNCLSERAGTYLGGALVRKTVCFTVHAHMHLEFFSAYFGSFLLLKTGLVLFVEKNAS